MGLGHQRKKTVEVMIITIVLLDNGNNILKWGQDMRIRQHHESSGIEEAQAPAFEGWHISQSRQRAATSCATCHGKPHELRSTLLVSSLITPIVVPHIIPYITHFKEFRLWYT